MYFEVHEIIKRLQKEEIVIYGTGMYAKRMYAILDIFQMQSRVKCFVVSEIGSLESIDNVPVIAIDQLKKHEKKYTVLVAVSRRYIEEIQTNLADFCPDDVLYMADYEREDDTFLPWLYAKNREELSNYITNGLISCQKITSKYELDRVSKDLLFSSQKDSYREKRNKIIVLFVCLITARTMRIASVLKSAGYEIVVYKVGNFEYVGDKELQEKGIAIRRHSVPQEILYEILKLHPYACYLDPSKGEYQICGIITLFKEYFGKIVLAPYDIRNGSIIGDDEWVYTVEKYCFENADGIIWRYFSENFLKEKLGFAYKGNSIFIPDCCTNYEINEGNKCGKLKICCMPTHAHEFLETDVDQSEYTHEATLWEILDRIGGQDECIFHAFFWNVTNEERALLEEAKKGYPNFNYFTHIDHKELIEHILPAYDYGCSINTNGEVPCYPHGIKIGSGKKRSENVLRYGSSNKFYDFISAGLSVIATIPTELCRYLSEYGVIVDMDLEHFDIQYLKEHRERYGKNAMDAKSKLLIENYSSVLTGFFESL